MRHSLVLFVCLTLHFASNAQQISPADSTAAVQPIVQLFEALKTSDTVKLSSCFTDAAMLQSISKSPAGQIKISTETLKDFTAVMATITPGDADERYQITRLHTDGTLATAWVPYHFYYKGNFSHCGTNSFQLINTGQGWKILSITDTRRKQSCL